MTNRQRKEKKKENEKYKGVERKREKNKSVRESDRIERGSILDKFKWQNKKYIQGQSVLYYTDVLSFIKNGKTTTIQGQNILDTNLEEKNSY